ncbi:MAG: Sapep family Mn(2+)-dependent dipeptidase [Acidobacteria bacterium]|nr:Sapep family Mn(2+)-dependent dipeptidase [Acidobacteriota bacterium]MBV9478878.1 Sapep family Mn(2+)-dependent dipeptidase [Acidobacteriota bacterium]
MIVASLLLATSLATHTTAVLEHYRKHEAQRLVPMLSEVVRFPTYQNNDEAHAQQKEWLLKTAHDLGFSARNTGKIVEIDLPASVEPAPILGLVVHGDVQPVDVEAWTIPPFEGRVVDGYMLGRGAADDKGPLVQALLAMKALKESRVRRTHHIRLLVGSEEESDAKEIPEYLKEHQPPDYSLVLDSEFPVVVGEKAWDALAVATTLDSRPGVEKPYRVDLLDAGLSTSIVPDHAEARLFWTGEHANWQPLMDALTKVALPEGTRLVLGPQGAILRVVTYGHSAHAGVNIEGGRNALVALARVLEGQLPTGGADDLLAFARLAGQDLHGTGLGITDSDPIWGRYSVNVATIKRDANDAKTFVFVTNLRRIPPRTAPQARAYLEAFVADFNKRTGASLTINAAKTYFEDEPLGFDPHEPLVQRLMKAYARATGVASPKPAISGGGTYAKRLPNSIAFGMWFPGKPYPGHDVDEKISVDDLQRGARVLIDALVDIATQPRIAHPFMSTK